MSFEGYYQVLCSNGHYETFDVIWNTVEFWACSDCDLPAVWYNLVDVTNGSYDEDGNRIDGYVHLKCLKEFYSTCEKCGVKHILSPAIYEIPKDKGHTIERSK